ncbi:MAG: flagellar filament capping protein FliD [Treponema sp.]|nr:flagellar filament capping protein FliD [Treponema sp.]
MAGLNIPGVTDQYKTNDTVEKLMQVERIPLTREQKSLDQYNAQRDAWRDVNRLLSSLRDSTKNLYSFENPFNNKLTESTDEFAITAEANRSASFQSFKVDVIQPATADRFLSGELENNYKVPQGTYTFRVGEKQLTFNWKGGTLKDFSEAVNKRGKNIVKTMIVGASAGKKTLLIEGLQTGTENQIIFEDDAEKFAKEIGMISPLKDKAVNLGKGMENASTAPSIDFGDGINMPALSRTNVSFEDDSYNLNPRGAFKLDLPDILKNDKNYHITFTLHSEETEDITDALNEKSMVPELPSGGFAEFAGIEIENFSSETLLKVPATPPEPLEKINSERILYALLKDGTEKLIPTRDVLSKDLQIDLPLSEYENISSLIIRNRNTGHKISLSKIETYNPQSKAGYEPINAISTAGDAILKYEGITITRPTNDIDDVVPEITLHLHEKTEKPATITVKPDTEASKTALIDFVGKYNQTVAKINILSQNKSEIVNELDYLTQDEKDAEMERLGMFQTEFSLTSIKSNMSSILSASYRYDDNAEVTMLSDLGIATNASGFGGGYSQSKLRGYLEIDEKKLDSALENHLDDIKGMFGFDSDGDLIIDSGIAYKLDKQIGAYTQTGGILALKTSALDSKIKDSEKRIATLESQLEVTEANLRNKYGQMEGSLNSLENQQNTISNFTRQQQNNR